MDEQRPEHPQPPRTAPGVGGSFTERYRGTQWGQPVEVVPVRSSAGKPSGTRVVAMAAGLVMVVLAGTVGAIGLFGQGGPMAPAAAALELVPRSAVSSPAPSSPTASSRPGESLGVSGTTPAPVTSPAPATPPVATATPAPVAPPPLGSPAPLKGRGQVIDAMVARLSEPASTARMEMEMSATFASETLRIEARFDVSGEDASGWMDMEGGGVSGRVEMVMAHGMVHMRAPGIPWDSRELPDGESSGIVGSVAVEDLILMRYQGVVHQDGRRLHRLTLVDLDWPLMTRALLPEQQMELREVSLEMLVDDFGRLVSQTIRAEGRMRDLDGKRVPMVLDMETRFSRWGEPVTITVPRTLSPSS